MTLTLSPNISVLAHENENTKCPLAVKELKQNAKKKLLRFLRWLTTFHHNARITPKTVTGNASGRRPENGALRTRQRGGSDILWRKAVSHHWKRSNFSWAFYFERLRCEIRSRWQEMESINRFRFDCFGSQNQSRNEKGPLSEAVHRTIVMVCSLLMAWSELISDK